MLRHMIVTLFRLKRGVIVAHVLPFLLNLYGMHCNFRHS